MSEEDIVVGVSGSYTICFWVVQWFWAIVLLPLFGLGILVILVSFWYKRSVVNRTRAILDPGRFVVRFDRGRWFVLDDDAIPIRSIDNVKIDRSIFGKLFGWVKFSIETRSENYEIRYADPQAAEKFRDNFIGSNYL